MQTSKIFFILLVTLGAETPALALQNIDVQPNHTYLVKASATEMNRISIVNQKIRETFTVDDTVLVKTDPEKNFITALLQTDKPANIIITAWDGSQYGVVLSPAQIPVEFIILNPQNSSTTAPLPPKDQKEKASSLDDEIKKLIIKLATNSPIQGAGYLNSPLNQEIPVWKETKIVLKQRISGYYAKAERYTITNLTDKEMHLSEKEFYAKNVLAVSIESSTIQPKQSTQVYVVFSTN